MLSQLADKIDNLNDFIGRAVSWLMLGMTLIILAVIFFSAFFRLGWVWLSELALYMHAVLFTAGAAYALRHDAHVRIDIFYSRLSPIGRAWVNFFGTLILLIPSCVAVLFFSRSYVLASWAVLEHSAEGQGLPAVFLLKTMILIMPTLLILQGLSILIKALAVIRGNNILTDD